MVTNKGWNLLKKWLIAVGICILVMAGTGFGGYLYAMDQIQGGEAQEAFELTIETGEPLKQVLSKLEAHDLLGNAQWRYLYMRFKQPDYTYQAGEYRIEKGESLEEALAKFQNGEVVQAKLVRVTIPEGWNVKQIARRLAENKLGEEETYLNLLDDPDYYKEKRQEFAFLPPLNESVKYPFEGYLFPETYQFSKGATEEEVIERILEHTQQIVEQLASEDPEIIEEPHKVFTLASIIERETVLPEERAKVAGVFANRMKESWRIESCATIQYVLGKQRDRILYEDLEVEDSYNTYLNDGLPPGPIASPGLASLEAALDPMDHDYFFFVTKKDGSQGHYFAKTLEEHKRNNANSRGTW